MSDLTNNIFRLWFTPTQYYDSVYNETGEEFYKRTGVCWTQIGRYDKVRDPKNIISYWNGAIPITEKEYNNYWKKHNLIKAITELK
jgi:hypothetical protein